MKLSDKQKEFWTNAKARWNIKTGATRSGKTYLDYFMIPKRIRACKDEGLIVLLGNTQGTITRNLLEPMRNIWGLDMVGAISSNNKVKLFGKDVYVLGADKKNQVSRLQGAGIEYCYGDEITTWSQDVFQMLKSRLDKPNSCFDGTCNPDSPNHWFKQFLDSNADIYYQHYTIDDNPFLSDSFVSALKKEYQGTVFYNRFILGQWTLAQGLVYDMFCDDMIIDYDKDYHEYYIACDYGVQNPCVFLLIGVDKEDMTADVIDEYYYDGRKMGVQKTNSSYLNDLIKFKKDRYITSVIIDPSASSFIAELRQNGIPTIKANNDVLQGIRYTQNKLVSGSIKIHRRCKNLLDEFHSYSWNAKATKDEVIKEFDHALDSLRYFVYSIFRKLEHEKQIVYYSGKGARQC